MLLDISIFRPISGSYLNLKNNLAGSTAARESQLGGFRSDTNYKDKKRFRLLKVQPRDYQERGGHNFKFPCIGNLWIEIRLLN